MESSTAPAKWFLSTKFTYFNKNPRSLHQQVSTFLSGYRLHFVIHCPGENTPGIAHRQIERSVFYGQPMAPIILSKFCMCLLQDRKCYTASLVYIFKRFITLSSIFFKRMSIVSFQYLQSRLQTFYYRNKYTKEKNSSKNNFMTFHENIKNCYNRLIILYF